MNEYEWCSFVVNFFLQNMTLLDSLCSFKCFCINHTNYADLYPINAVNTPIFFYYDLITSIHC